jgi:unsaturated rhamnogalacturonyl hydrolase
MGAFINAAVEMEMLPTQYIGKGKTVVLDYYFNNEWKEDATGKQVRWHYTWSDKSNSGFAMLGDIFRRYGAKTDFLETAPTAGNLQNASVYIIVDPDTEKESKSPNLIKQADANAIAKWVEGGGVLILMTNDNGNADIKNANILSEKFGVHFNEDNFNLVEGKQFEQGRVNVDKDNPVLKTAGKLYIKELATLLVSSPATTVLGKAGINIAAIARYGKGSVFIIGDPWLYNEYIDGRKLPADFENFKAAEDLVKWSLMQVRKK